MAMSNRDRLRSIRDKNYSAMAIENYRRSKGKVKLMIKNTKVNYFQKKCKECKNIWNIIDEIVLSKRKTNKYAVLMMSKQPLKILITISRTLEETFF